MRRDRRPIGAVVFSSFFALTGCSSAGHTGTPAATTSAVPTSATAASTTASSAPSITVPAASTVAWTALHNPLYSQPDHAVKDPALVAYAGGWVMLFSRVDANGQWRVGITRSHDLRSWSAAGTMPHDPRTEGEASPDVVREPDGTFVVTYQSFVHDRDGAQSKLYARTTTDFTAYSAPIRLLANVLNTPGDRLIDPALSYSPAGLLLGFKTGTTAAGSVQHFELARSPGGQLAGPWVVIGRPDISVFGDTIENYEFLDVGGRRALLATSNTLDRPELFLLAGPAGAAAGWLHWSAGRELVVPRESWNPGTGVTGSTFEHANCAFLVGGGTKLGGFYYLVYGDSPELTAFKGAGHDVFGLARSTDLVHWSVPPA